MDDLEELRARRMRELQERQAAAGQGRVDGEAAEAQQAAAQEAVERFLQQALEPEARERLTRIRMSRPDLADAVTRYVVGAAQQGQLRGRLRDEDLKALLTRMQPQDRDIKITRK